MNRPLLIAVMGPTASGKTDVAEELADEFEAQLINADTFQAYRGLDIGTAKPTETHRYKLIDIKDPDEPFGLGEWVGRALAILKDLFAAGRSSVIVGGSGINIRALFEGYGEMKGPPPVELRARLNDRMAKEGLEPLLSELRATDPQAFERVDKKNPVRVIRALERAHIPASTSLPALPPFFKAKVAIDLPKSVVDSRIAARVDDMLAKGWVQEVERLRNQGYRPTAPAFRAHGYREIWRVLEGALELVEAKESTIAQVRRYSKRQRTWLRKEPELHFLRAESREDLVAEARRIIMVLREGDR